MADDQVTRSPPVPDRNSLPCGTGKVSGWCPLFYWRRPFEVLLNAANESRTVQYNYAAFLIVSLSLAFGFVSMSSSISTNSFKVHARPGIRETWVTRHGLIESVDSSYQYPTGSAYATHRNFRKALLTWYEDGTKSFQF